MLLWSQVVESRSTLCDSSFSVDHNSQKVLYILCNGMTMKKLVMFAVNMRKIKALTDCDETVALIGKGR